MTKRILIMDDEEAIRDVLKEVLERMGNTVSVATEGNEALSLYEKAFNSGKTFDAVSLDLTVEEGMDGKETMKNLFRFDPNVKAVIFSGNITEDIEKNYESYGIKGIVKKPFIKELIDLINSL